MGSHRASPTPVEERVGFRVALRDKTFSRLFVAETQSIFGDQLARVALSVLVFDVTDSAALTAAAYALTFLPAIIGGSLLGGLPERFGARTVMIGCELARALLFAVMALPATPLPVVLAAVAVAVLLGPVFTAAQVSFLARALEPEVFRTATASRMIASQSVQVAGFVCGGVLVSLLGPHGTLALDAASFVASATLIAGLRRLAPIATRRAAAAREPERPDVEQRSASLWQDIRSMAAVPALARLMGLSSLAGVFVVPEGFAVPFADAAGADTVHAGFLLAAIPLGSVVGAVLLVQRIPAGRRDVAMVAMSVGCGVPIVISGFVPDWRVALLCWFVSGALSAYQVETIAQMMRATPEQLRSRLIGLGSAVLYGAQGAGLLVFGAISAAWGAPAAILAAGAVGVVLATVLARPIHHQRHPLLPAAVS